MAQNFKLIPNKGFQLTFENGNTISVMFGVGNYCSNRNTLKITDGYMVSDTAEIAIRDNEGRWHNFGYDSVKGYIDSNEVAQWVSFASSMSINPIQNKLNQL